MVRSAIKYSKNHYNYTLVYNKKNLKSEGHSQFEKWKRYGYKEKGGGSVNVVLIDSELDCGNSTAPYLLLHFKKTAITLRLIAHSS